MIFIYSVVFVLKVNCCLGSGYVNNALFEWNLKKQNMFKKQNQLTFETMTHENRVKIKQQHNNNKERLQEEFKI